MGTFSYVILDETRFCCFRCKLITTYGQSFIVNSELCEACKGGCVDAFGEAQKNDGTTSAVAILFTGRHTGLRGTIVNTMVGPMVHIKTSIFTLFN